MKQLSEIYRQLLTENEFYGKTLLVVDIQPSYSNSLSFNMLDFCDFINENHSDNRVVFLYNGPELGMESESDLINWYFEEGMSEDAINNSEFFEKGYAFFRSCMDEGYDQDDIIRVLKYMWENEIWDARDLDVGDWGSIGDVDEMREFIDGGDTMWIPLELMEYLQNMSNIVIMGGDRNECMAEVMIALDVLGKPYKEYGRYSYP